MPSIGSASQSRAYVVEATGFEPTTSASRTQRSTKLSHASKYLIVDTKVVRNVVKPNSDQDFRAVKPPKIRTAKANLRQTA